MLNYTVLVPTLNQSCFENPGSTTEKYFCFFFFLVTNTFNTNMHDLFIMAALDDGGDVVYCGREMLGPCRLVRCRLETGLPGAGTVQLGDRPSGTAVVNIGETPCLALSYRWVILLNQSALRYDQTHFFIFTARNSSFGKVMFSQLFVALSTGGGWVSLLPSPFWG